ncbi:serine hydrolase domain-containing protein [Vallitalea okinawensis]|uniref:serine hydrolase domain-containing protein n=1 Tax=Vallitalea okinawensis TaxID=2078660 RepID=UPI000CFC7905|nr:serine hydrolase [Vallitalea okinawensis]
MKLVVRILVVIIALLVLGYIAVDIVSSPLSEEEGTLAIEKSLVKFLDKYDEVDNVTLRLYSGASEYDESFVVGSRDNGEPISVNSPYHIASIGKTLTTTIFYMLDEEGILSVQDPINLYIEEVMLEDLFVYGGGDYSSQVTIEHLLTHTSGVACFFDGPVVEGYGMQELMIVEPDKYWTPEELIDFSREYQVPVGIPGETFNYSDTGYMLLMLILEKVMGIPYYQVFHDKLFDPLGMRDSYVMLETSPFNEGTEDILGMKLDGKDISKSKVLSVGRSDGGVVSTTGDLLIFFNALQNGELISQQSFEQMKSFDKIYDKGIMYGSGMMSFNLKELALIFPGLPTIYGGVGTSGTFMMYDESKDLYIIMNVGVVDMMEESVTQIIKILMIYNQIQ